MTATTGVRTRWGLVVRWGLPIFVGLGIYLLPMPDHAGLTAQGWTVFAVFAATILSFLTQPLPMAPMVLIALVVLGSTRTLEFKQAVSGYGSATVWLVVAAFLIAGTVGRTGLGRRIALILVRALGRSTVGLGYAFCTAELVLAPFIPSNTARGGGVVAPIVKSVAQALGSHPGARARRAGEYLIFTAAQANLVTAAMFLTAMAANPYVTRAAAEHLNVDFGWHTWALGAIVPGLVSLALLPLVIRLLAPPEILDARPARDVARRELAEMGPWTRDQKVMAGVFVLMLLLWSTTSLHEMEAVTVAWMGVCILLLTNTEKWSDIRTNAGAWDALVWLGGLVSLATLLKELGVASWMADAAASNLGGVVGVTAAVLFAVTYFYSMYGFSMLTGHIFALAIPFLAIAASPDMGIPPLLFVALLAYFSSLCGCTTHYSTAPVVIYFGLGYTSVPRWFYVGFVVSLVHMLVWLTLGMAWWKLLGWW